MKVDGVNVAISFSNMGDLLLQILQSRGHFLTENAIEKHFSLFKQWAYILLTELCLILGDCCFRYSYGRVFR